MGSKWFSKIGIALAGIAMAVGVGVALEQKEFKKAEAAVGDTRTDVIIYSDTSSYLKGKSTSAYQDFELTGSESGAVYAIHSMGFTNSEVDSSHYAIRWGAAGYLYCKTTASYNSASYKLKSVSATTTQNKNIKIFGSNTKYEAKATATELTTLAATSSGADYEFTTAYKFIGINGTASSTILTRLEIVWEEVNPTPSVTIEQSETYIGLGDSKTYTAVKSNAGDAEITWASSNPSVATIDSNGAITTVSVGTTNITASVEVNSITYSSIAVPLHIESYTNSVTFRQAFDKGATSIAKGGTTITATSMNSSNDGYYKANKNTAFVISSSKYIYTIAFTCMANGSSQYGPGCFTYSGSDGEWVATEGNTGTWTGLSKSITLTASSNQVRATEIVVTYASSMTCDANATVRAEETTTITCSQTGVTWISLNELVATVSETAGVVTISGVAIGNTTITGKKAGYIDVSCAVTVTASVKPYINFDAVDFTENHYTGDAFEIGVTYGNLTEDITWTVSSNNILTYEFTDNLDGTGTVNGTIDAVCNGVTLTASANNKSAVATFTAAQSEVTSIVLNKTSATLAIGENLTLSATVDGVGNYSDSVTWTSSAPTVVSVTNAGVVTAAKIGSVTITATAVGGSTAIASIKTFKLGTSTSNVDIRTGLEDGDLIEEAELFNDGSDMIFATFDKGGNESYAPKYVSNGDAVRFYKDNIVTVESTKANIQRVVFTAPGSGDSPSNTISADSGNMDGKVWTYGSSPVDSVEFTFSGARRFTHITVVYFDADSFVTEYMHMTDYDPDLDNSQGDGSCEDYYPLASSAYGVLFDADKTAFCTQNTYVDARARLSAWAAVYGETLNLSTHTLGSTTIGGLTAIIAEDNNKVILVIIIIAGISTLAIGGYFFIRRKHQ